MRGAMYKKGHGAFIVLSDVGANAVRGEQRRERGSALWTPSHCFSQCRGKTHCLVFHSVGQTVHCCLSSSDSLHPSQPHIKCPVTKPPCKPLHFPKGDESVTDREPKDGRLSCVCVQAGRNITGRKSISCKSCSLEQYALNALHPQVNLITLTHS